MENRFLRYYGYRDNGRKTSKERTNLLKGIYNNHTQHVRDFVHDYNSNKTGTSKVYINLIEITLENNETNGQYLATIFDGLKKECWAKHNANYAGGTKLRVSKQRGKKKQLVGQQ